MFFYAGAGYFRVGGHPFTIQMEENLSGYLKSSLHLPLACRLPHQ